MKILVFDNYDSFTYNLVHLVEKILHQKVEVYRNDKIPLEKVNEFDKIILSPGPGIPEEIQSRIFDPFYTTKDIGKGTGMGLDVVSRIMRQHNGTVKVKSEPGHTEFIVCLPIKG